MTASEQAAAEGALGLQWPLGAQGQRGSTALATGVVAAALDVLDPARAARLRADKGWRKTYPGYFRALVESALPSADQAVGSAEAALQAAWQGMRWVGDERECSLDQAFARAAVGTPLNQVQYQGQGDARPAPWQVPYRGQLLGGDALRRRIDDWQARHIIEPGAAQALHRCAQNPHWFDLSDRHVVLLGAGSEAGALPWLARWRANLIAVDLPRPALWQRIGALVQAGNARLWAPQRGDAGLAGQGPEALSGAGANLLLDTPLLADWLCRLQHALGKPFDLISLGYLDGEGHVRLTLAMDWIAQALRQSHPHNSFAWMATPTDVFAVPEALAQQACQAWRTRPLASRAMQAVLRPLSGGRLFAPNVEGLVQGPQGRRYGVVDCQVIQQGPNYALAKRLQQMRALEMRAHGRHVSLNIAPSTTTRSVVKNAALKAGFAGADLFGVEVFEPATTNALMAALWVHDLRHPQSAAHPAQALAHPFELMMAQACHGGLWSVAYQPRSVLPFSAALGWWRLRAGAAR